MMKRGLPVLLLLCIILTGCSSSASTSALNAAQEEAYQEGYAQGYEEGFDKGESAGYDKGYDEGHADGIAEAEEAAQESQSETTPAKPEEDTTTEDPHTSQEELPPDEWLDDATVYVQLYVLNTNTKKFHYQSCSSVQQIHAENYAERETTREQLIAEGYAPCGRCNP